MKKIDAIRFRATIESAAALQDDADALKNIDLYPSWREGLAVEIGARYRYAGTLYKCVQAHTTQADWAPGATPALWTVVSLEDWPEWVQPTGAHDVYQYGDKVSYDGKHWISEIDNNSWVPGVYGWAEA